MHYVENHLPDDIRDKFSPPESLSESYPSDKWIIGTWEPESQPWYKIQEEAYHRGYIKDLMIGSSKCMFFRVDQVVELYKEALIDDPYAFYNL